METIAFNSTRKERTDRLLDYMRGEKNEFTILHGILCMGHGQEIEDSLAMDKVYNLRRVAARLDEMNRESLKEAKKLLGEENSL